MEPPRQDILAECKKCARPFVAGKSAGGRLTLGIPGGSGYIEHLHIDNQGLMSTRGVVLSCPYPGCSGEGQIPDGVYEFVEDGYRLLSEMTPGETQRLADALLRYERGEATEDEVVDATPKEARGFVQSALKKPDWKFWTSVVLSIALAVGSEVTDIDRDRKSQEELRKLSSMVQMLDEHQQETIRLLRQRRALDAPAAGQRPTPIGPASHRPGDRDTPQVP
jgi:hypothetical protein